ncbi:methyltransferase [Microbacterium sp. NPDC076911]|uniref:methyltransferase n=1 Tax=Microbacterium sp. NPDC076911 TaxID=3154958 RepID=UPI00342A7FEE
MSEKSQFPLDSYGVLNTITAYQQAAAVSTGVETGLFTALASGRQTSVDVAEACETHPVPTRSLLDALSGMGFLHRDIGDNAEPHYRLAGAAVELAAGGALVDLVRKEAYLATQWQSLEKTVRTGTPIIAPWRTRLADDPSATRSFLRALVTLARLIGADLTRVPELGEGRDVIDAGGGLGSYAVPLAAGGARVRLVELATVAEWCREELEGSAIEVIEADLLTDVALGVEESSADSVLFSHLLHDLSDEDALVVLRKAVDALRPGGAVVILEIPGDAPLPLGGLFDLMMQIETPGRARQSDELIQLLAAAGFENIHRADVADPNLVLIGERS